jgi:beta-N-acetylhexosaminidase
LRYLSAAFAFTRLFLIFAVLPFAIGWRTPLFAGWRYTALAVLIALPLLIVALEIWSLRRTRTRFVRMVSVTSLVIAVIAAGATLALETQFQYQRRVVLAADPGELEKLGAHIFIGYRNRAMLDAVMQRRALAGIFLTTRNVEGKSIEAIHAEIEALQASRRAQGLDPLWIATDQEGGPVSRLSPPLRRMPPLGEVVALYQDNATLMTAVSQYAGRQGSDLRRLGVNLNFAPVVDVNHGLDNPDDRLSRISTRALSTDPAVVAMVADTYCATMRRTGVACTLKHFPGLGRVYQDTHKVTAELSASPGELEATDWLPFRELMGREAPFTMLSHARLTALDPDRPASFSNAVVNGLIRGTWKYDGVLITDDFAMGAVTLSHEGAAGGAIAALNAGVDLILVSYDPDQYFPVMYALLAADRDGRLDQDALARSKARLKRAASPA